MPKMNVIIYGAGGHAAVVIDALLARGEVPIKCLVDDDPTKWGQYLLGLPIVSPQEIGDKISDYLIHLALGDNQKRREKAEELEKQGGKFLIVIHPKAIVSPTAQTGEGTFIGGGAVVDPLVRIGKHCIINNGAVVAHHCQIGDFVHIAPNATLGGEVCIGEGTLVGLSATILRGIEIGENCIIGTGAVVIENVPPNTTVVGVPAKPIERR